MSRRKPADLNKLNDPAFRKQRAVAGGKMSGRAAKLRAIERASGMTPSDAYQTGFVNGYRRAYVYWKAWAVRAGMARGAA